MADARRAKFTCPVVKTKGVCNRPTYYADACGQCASVAKQKRAREAATAAAALVVQPLCACGCGKPCRAASGVRESCDAKGNAVKRAQAYRARQAAQLNAEAEPAAPQQAEPAAPQQAEPAAPRQAEPQAPGPPADTSVDSERDDDLDAAFSLSVLLSEDRNGKNGALVRGLARGLADLAACNSACPATVYDFYRVGITQQRVAGVPAETLTAARVSAAQQVVVYNSSRAHAAKVSWVTTSRVDRAVWRNAYVDYVLAVVQMGHAGGILGRVSPGVI